MDFKLKNVLIVGAGLVGTSIAKHLLTNNTANVILYDIKPGIAEGIALDLSHCRFNSHQAFCKGTSELDSALTSIDLVIITAGIPRHKNQKRIDLLHKNASILLNITEKIVLVNSHIPIFIITNPVDILSSILKTAYPELEVYGMGCGLDTMRFRYYIASYLDLSVGSINAFIAGKHDNDMIPLWNSATIGTIPIKKIINKHTQKKILKLTVEAGHKVVSLLGRGSSIAAGVLAAQIIHSYINNLGIDFSINCYQENCLGLKKTMISLPYSLSKNNQTLIPIEHNEYELNKLRESSLDIENSVSVFFNAF